VRQGGARGDPKKFREELVERLAFDSPWGRHTAMYGFDQALADDLGVAKQTLLAASVRVREGFVPAEVDEEEARREPMHIDVPAPLAPSMRYVARRYRMSHGQLVRALLHTVMQTEREPLMRAARQWMLSVDVPVKESGKRIHIGVYVSRGLLRALDARAAAYGVTRRRYIYLWFADMLEGRLSDLVLEPVEVGQMYDDERGYVLPAVSASGS
jgi:hypothetical protein